MFVTPNRLITFIITKIASTRSYIYFNEWEYTLYNKKYTNSSYSFFTYLILAQQQMDILVPLLTQFFYKIHHCNYYQFFHMYFEIEYI